MSPLRTRRTRTLPAAVALAVTTGLMVATAAPAAATPPPPDPLAGSHAVTGSVRGVATGSAVTAPQYFEVLGVERAWFFAYYPFRGPGEWQHVRRLDSLAAGGAHTAKYVVVGAPLPDEFWLGFDGVSGHVGIDRRPYEQPNLSPGVETITRLSTYVVAAPQLPVPGVPGTVAAAITLPTPVPALS